MTLAARILLWRYRASMSDLDCLKNIALPAIAQRRQHINDLADRLARRGITVPKASAEDVRRDIERQLKMGVLQ